LLEFRVWSANDGKERLHTGKPCIGLPDCQFKDDVIKAVRLKKFKQRSVLPVFATGVI
jgi:hypothetical protein